MFMSHYATEVCKCPEKYTISIFESQHNHIGSKLKELKDIVIRYYPEKENDLLNAVLFDIINCEQDLKSHCRMEDQLFVPTVEKLEKSLREAIPSRRAKK